MFFGLISICVKQKKKEEQIHLGKGGGKTSTGLFWPKTIRPWHNFLIYGAVNSNGNLAMCLFQQMRLHWKIERYTKVSLLDTPTLRKVSGWLVSLLHFCTGVHVSFLVFFSLLDTSTLCRLANLVAKLIKASLQANSRNKRSANAFLRMIQPTL